MEVLSREFRIGCPWKLIVESLDRLKMRLENWKEGLEVKELKVNVYRAKVMCSRHDTPNTRMTSVKFPCRVCWKGVGTNSILHLSCKKWVHKRCSGIRECFRNCNDFICKTCWKVVEADDPFPACITIDGNELETVSELCYLGVTGQAGGYIDAVTARIRYTLKAFHELLPILTNRGVSLLNRGKVFEACVKSVFFYRSETWSKSTGDLSRIKISDHAMIQWICSLNINQQHSP